MFRDEQDSPFEARPSAVALLPQDLLRDHVVLVTGGGSGIGLAVADACAQSGAAVAILGRNQDKLTAATENLARHGTPVTSVSADVRDFESVDQAVERVRETLGPLTTVVAGAAGNFFAAAEDISSKGFRTVMEIDLLGSFHTARAAHAQLAATRGSILFISAGQSYLPITHQAHVGAAKAGIDNLMKNLALEWGPYGVRSNSIVPGPVRGTEGMTRLSGPTGEEVWTRTIPLGRFAELEEIAAMSVVLASPLASYVTGAQIVVDGGLGLNGFGAISRAVSDSIVAP